MPLLRRLIGSLLRRTRLRQGLTLREVAALARVSVAYLSEVERGRKEVSSEVLAAICTALGLQLTDLLDGVRTELDVELDVERAVERGVERGSVPARGARQPVGKPGARSVAARPSAARPLLAAARPPQSAVRGAAGRQGAARVAVHARQTVLRSGR